MVFEKNKLEGGEGVMMLAQDEAPARVPRRVAFLLIPTRPHRASVVPVKRKTF